MKSTLLKEIPLSGYRNEIDFVGIIIIIKGSVLISLFLVII